MEEASSTLETVGGVPDIEGKQRGSKAAFLASPTIEGKRKIGRPAGRSRKKRKITVNQPRRTKTPVGNKAFKINENESGESSSDEKGIKEEVKSEDNHKDLGKTDSEDLEIQQIEPDPESSRRGKAVQQEVAETVSQVDHFSKAPDIEMGERYRGQDSEKPDKLEVMVDPVQAILLDTIPSLGMKNVKTKNRISEEEKPSADPSAGPTRMSLANCSRIGRIL